MCTTQAVIIVAGREKVCPVFMEIIIVILDLVSTNFQGKSSSIFVSLLIIFLSIFEVKIEVARDRAFEHVIEETVEIFEFSFPNLE